MSAMAVIFTRPVPTRHYLGVLVWMSTIFFPVPAIQRRTPWSSPLLSSAHHGSPVRSPSILLASAPIIPKSVCLGTLVVPTFAATFPVLHHDQVQVLERYVIAPPGNLALRRHHPKGNKYDTPRSPKEH